MLATLGILAVTVTSSNVFTTLVADSSVIADQNAQMMTTPPVSIPIVLSEDDGAFYVDTVALELVQETMRLRMFQNDQTPNHCFLLYRAFHDAPNCMGTILTENIDDEDDNAGSPCFGLNLGSLGVADCEAAVITKHSQSTGVCTDSYYFCEMRPGPGGVYDVFSNVELSPTAVTSCEFDAGLGQCA